MSAATTCSECGANEASATTTAMTGTATLTRGDDCRRSTSSQTKSRYTAQGTASVAAAAAGVSDTSPPSTSMAISIPAERAPAAAKIA